jgi:hypothetical protein
MNKITLLLSALLFFSALHAQQVPTINSPANGGQSDANFWARSGNLGAGVNNQNNIFGTKWNSPIYTVTGNGFGGGQTYRMKVNGIFLPPTQYSINGYSSPQVNTTGYVLIGQNNTSITD